MSAQRCEILAALGEPTRLSLVERLVEEGPQPVGKLADGLQMTRQGVRKHLKVLENADVVSVQKEGREQVVQLRVESFDDVRRWMSEIAGKWELRLSRLKDLVESSED